MKHLPKTALGFLVFLTPLASGRTLLAEPPAGAAQEDASAVAQTEVEKVEETDAGRFLRIKRDAAGEPVALETAIVRYVPAAGEGDLAVDLIGCVHVAQRSYYGRLNKRFDDYDVVLYELVAPKGTRIRGDDDRRSLNPLSMLQGMTESMLELESQTAYINYTRENFVHADMSPDDMAQAMRERGDDGLTVFLSATADALREQNLRELERERNPKPQPEAKSPDPLALLFDANRAVKLKRMLAEQFEALGTNSLGDTLNTLLIEDRNKAAMRVFQTELAKGRKRIAIFYGAGHMADFEKRLLSDFGLRRDRVEWMAAWNLKL
ncbi:MAG: hypothetical protein ABIP48_21290 [Planctomycetota bacterium]